MQQPVCPDRRLFGISLACAWHGEVAPPTLFSTTGLGDPQTPQGPPPPRPPPRRAPDAWRSCSRPRGLGEPVRPRATRAVAADGHDGLSLSHRLGKAPSLRFGSVGTGLPGRPVKATLRRPRRTGGPVPPRPSKVAAFSKGSWLLRPQDEADERGTRAPRPACLFLRGLEEGREPAAPHCVWARGSSTGPRRGVFSF